MGSRIRKSPWIYHLNAGSCNGCDIELVSCITPVFDVERLGCVLKNSPRHADIIVVTGPVTSQTHKRLLRIREQTPEKKIVLALGACTISGGLFRGSYSIKGPLDSVIPVDVFVPGCPPRPQAIINGIAKALEMLK